MLTLTNINHSLGGRSLIEDCNFNLNDGWKVGVVGVNGAGKSTLFKLIAGEMEADSGKITLSSNQRMGMVRQDIPDTDDRLIQVVIDSDEELASLLKESETCIEPNRLSDIYLRLSELDAFSAEARAAILLAGLGFKAEEMEQPFSSFSGGWRMRVALAGALFVQPELLLLDEPTNHLDLEAIMWLESYLIHYPHSILMISHDREILNKSVDRILHIDKKIVTLYTGNYDDFERERAAKLGMQQKMHEKQQVHRAHMQAFIDRFKAQATKARQAQSRIKALERMDIVDAVIADRAIKFRFPDPKKLAPQLISVVEVSIGYEIGKPILTKISETIDENDRIALLGTNGSGKSTLMKLIAGKLTPMKGEMTRTNKLKIGYFSQHQTEELDVEDTPYEALYRLVHSNQGETKESNLRAKLGQFGFNKDMSDTKIGKLSGGEKARLLFAFMSFDAPHLLLLDEPTNHLDVDAREALVQALNAYKGAVIMVSHDPSMVERVADRLWLIKDGECNKFDGDLEDYRKFIIQSRREEKKDAKRQKDKQQTSSIQPAIDKEAVANTPNSNATKPPKNNKLLKETEREINKLSKEKEALEIILAKPETYQDSKLQKEIQIQYHALSSQLEDLEYSWLAAQE